MSDERRVSKVEKSPIAKAWDAWLISSEGRSCTAAETLVGNPQPDIYLKNRLWRAFMAGVKAGEANQQS